MAMPPMGVLSEYTYPVVSRGGRSKPTIDVSDLAERDILHPGQSSGRCNRAKAQQKTVC